MTTFIFITDLFSLSLTLAMAAGNDGSRTIELFKFIQKTYQDIGIYRPQSDRTRIPVNSKNWFLIFSYAEFFISSAAYLLFEANSMIEYEMTSFICLTVLLCVSLCLISFWQMRNVFHFIGNCERFIKQSE